MCGPVRHFVQVRNVFRLFAVDMKKNIAGRRDKGPKNSSNSDSPRPFPLIVDDNNELRLPYASAAVLWSISLRRFSFMCIKKLCVCFEILTCPVSDMPHNVHVFDNFRSADVTVQ